MLYTQYINLNYTHPLAEQLQDKLVNHNLVKLGIYLDINCHQSADVLSMVSSLLIALMEIYIFRKVFEQHYKFFKPYFSLKH